MQSLSISLHAPIDVEQMMQARKNLLRSGSGAVRSGAVLIRSGFQQRMVPWTTAKYLLARPGLTKVQVS